MSRLMIYAVKAPKSALGKALTYLREQKDVTLRELARGIGVSAPFLSDVEKGRRSAI